MSIESLHQELGIDFRAEERKQFLEEMEAVSENYASSLGQPGQETERRSQLKKLLEQLGEESAELSPSLDVLRLRRNVFTERGCAVPPRIRDLLHRYQFYLVHVPIALMPRPGWGFTELECIIEFNPEAPPDERPVAFQIFPHEIWQDVLKAWQGLAIGVGKSVGLDEEFEFKLDPTRLGTLPSEISAEARAALSGHVASGAGLILGPFNYHIWRPRIATSGRGHVQVRWRLEGEEYVTEGKPQLGIVLQVPRATRRVDIIGVLKVSKSFHLFTAEMRYVVNFLKERARQFFQAGAPLVHDRQWLNVTAGL